MNATDTPPVRDWKHRWLWSGCPWEAYRIWEEARWEPLEPDERLALALSVEWPDWIDNPTARDEWGELEEDYMLAIHAYSTDKEVPTHMLEPEVWIGERNLLDKRDSEWPF